MTRRYIASLVAVLAVGLFLGSAVVWSQVFRVQPVTPMVLSGGDFGFRIEGMRGSTAVGTLVVRVDGQWVAADFQGGPRPLTAK